MANEDKFPGKVLGYLKEAARPEFMRRLKQASVFVTLICKAISVEDLEAAVTRATSERDFYDAMGIVCEPPSVFAVRCEFNKATVEYTKAMLDLRNARDKMVVLAEHLRELGHPVDDEEA